MKTKRLKELLSYDKDTGVFTWIAKPNRKIVVGSIAGHIGTGGYLYIRLDSVKYLAHRLAMLYVGEDISSLQVDHINHNRADNRMCNLRMVTHQENHKNMTLRVDNNSDVTGVGWHKGSDSWRARITVDGIDINLGFFKKFSEAVDARKIAEVAYGFHENHGKEK